MEYPSKMIHSAQKNSCLFLILRKLLEGSRVKSILCKFFQAHESSSALFSGKLNGFPVACPGVGN